MDEKHIYLIHQWGSAFYKIGQAKDPASRLKDLQIASPQILELIYTSDGETIGCDSLESSLHEKFKDFHVRGEWYEFPLKLLDWVKDEMDTHFTIKDKEIMEGIFEWALPQILEKYTIRLANGEVSFVKK